MVSSDIEMHEVLLRHKRTWVFVKLELVAPRSCEASILGDVQNPIEHNPGQPALVDSALSRRAGLDFVQRCLPASTALSSCENVVVKTTLFRLCTRLVSHWHKQDIDIGVLSSKRHQKKE